MESVSVVKKKQDVLTKRGESKVVFSEAAVDAWYIFRSILDLSTFLNECK